MDKVKSLNSKQYKTNNVEIDIDYSKNLLSRSISSKSMDRMDELLIILSKLASPQKEKLFVEFALLGDIEFVV
jgi:hypothetical protein